MRVALRELSLARLDTAEKLIKELDILKNKVNNLNEMIESNSICRLINADEIKFSYIDNIFKTTTIYRNAEKLKDMKLLVVTRGTDEWYIPLRDMENSHEICGKFRDNLGDYHFDGFLMIAIDKEILYSMSSVQRVKLFEILSDTIVYQSAY